MIKAFFADIDGTLLNSEHQMTPATRDILRSCQNRMHMALVSARSPSGIYPILLKNNLSMAIVSYNGGWIQDENKNVLYEEGMPAESALELIAYLEEKIPAVTWCLYSGDNWIVKTRSDPRVRREEELVEAFAKEGTPEYIHSLEKTHKILCICPEGQASPVAEELSGQFPSMTIVPSSNMLVEVMVKGINKANAVRFLCDYWGVPLREAVAFGDNYNDLEMLMTVGNGVVMGNAPEEMKQSGLYVTSGNDDDGIEVFLKKYIER